MELLGKLLYVPMGELEGGALMQMTSLAHKWAHALVAFPGLCLPLGNPQAWGDE